LADGAYHIASAAIVLLRCAIDTTLLEIVNMCKVSLQQLMARLRQAKETDDWDMGDICLSQCNDSVAAVTAAHDMLQISEVAIQPTQEATEWPDPLIEGQVFSTASFLPMQNMWGYADDLQYPWANLWDIFEAPGTMN
jgi:hypothetical protein